MTLGGRNGYSNAELVEMFPRVPDSRCVCGARGVCTWVEDPRQLLCDACLEAPSRTTSHGGDV